MTLASLHAAERTLTWLGVGNVEGWLLRAHPAGSPPAESVLLRSGIVGYQIPALQATVLPVAPGDVVVFATDGIRTGFTRDLSPCDRPEDTVRRILRDHFKGTDDGLVLAARYECPQHE